MRKHADHVCETEFSDSVAFKITTSIANFLVPMSLIVIIYYKIFCEIKRRGNFSEMNRHVNRVSCAHHRNRNPRQSTPRTIAEEEEDDKDNNAGEERILSASSTHSSLSAEKSDTTEKGNNYFVRLLYTSKDSRSSTTPTKTLATSCSLRHAQLVSHTDTAPAPAPATLCSPSPARYSPLLRDYRLEQLK